jgi:hypothetical protein
MTARLENARVRIRRFQLVVGVGFFSCAAGALVSLAIGNRLRDVMPQIQPVALAQLLAMAIRQLWEFAVLPVACWALARVMPISPWRTALGAVATGEVFLSALDFFTGNLSLWFRAPYLGGLRLAFIALGVVVTSRAIAFARSSAERAERAAREAAERKKTQYDEFVKEAERVAALHEGKGEAAAANAEASTASEEGSEGDAEQAKRETA